MKYFSPAGKFFRMRVFAELKLLFRYLCWLSGSIKSDDIIHKYSTDGENRVKKSDDVRVTWHHVIHIVTSCDVECLNTVSVFPENETSLHLHCGSWVGLDTRSVKLGHNMAHCLVAPCPAAKIEWSLSSWYGNTAWRDGPMRHNYCEPSLKLTGCTNQGISTLAIQARSYEDHVPSPIKCT